MSLVTINLTGKKGKTAENGHRNGHAAAGYPTIEPLTLTLEITDPDVINAIQNEESGPVRDRFVQSALKIGVIALLQNQSPHRRRNRPPRRRNHHRKPQPRL